MSFFDGRKRIPRKRPVAEHASGSPKASPLVEKQSEDKTKVLLALGVHGYVDEHGGPRVIGMSKDFFRKVAVPFLERHAVGKDSVVVIFEQSAFLKDTSPATLVIARHSCNEIREAMERCHNQLSLMLDSTLNSGKPTADPVFDWGFNDIIRRLNSGQRKVLCVPEIITFEAVMKEMEFDEMESKIRLLSHPHNPAPGLLVLHLERMRLRLESDLLRDKTIVRMADDFRKTQHPSAILILRGLGHKQMRVLFDDRIYDVAVAAEGNYHPQFAVEAAEQFYRGELDKAGLGTLVLRDLRYDAILRSAGIDLCKAAHRRQTEFFRRAAEEAVRSCPKLPA